MPPLAARSHPCRGRCRRDRPRRPGGRPVSMHPRGRATRREQKAAAEAFANAWRMGHLAGLTFAGGSARRRHPGPDDDSRMTTRRRTRHPVTVGAVHWRKDAQPPTATATLNVSWRLPGGFDWIYPTTATLRQVGDRWLVAWAPAVVHPGLTAGQALQAQRTQPPRAEILGAGDRVLVTQRPVVDVGIQPSRADNPAATARQVAAIVAVDPDELAKRVAAAKPDTFVLVITLRREAYDAVRPAVPIRHGLPRGDASLARRRPSPALCSLRRRRHQGGGRRREARAAGRPDGLSGCRPATTSAWPAPPASRSASSARVARGRRARRRRRGRRPPRRHCSNAPRSPANPST